MKHYLRAWYITRRWGDVIELGCHGGVGSLDGNDDGEVMRVVGSSSQTVHDSAGLDDREPTDKLSSQIDFISPVGVNPSGRSKRFQVPGFGTAHFLDHCLKLIGLRKIKDEKFGGVIPRVG